ncbi:J domain-containing protein [Agarivorans sp.]|uniref:J domain-containing protein n=1 Tax=Agarivorans sp. TaxID=1872412 RepID=UPI003D036ADC
MTTHFQLFELPENATDEQIRTRYKQLATRCHPDKGGSSQLMIIIKNSYQKLVIGEGALPINQHLDDSNKQIIDLKKTIHQQQFYIQKLSVAIAKQAQQKETKRLKRILMPAALAVFAILVLVLAGKNYQSRQQLEQITAKLAVQKQQAASTEAANVASASDEVENDQSEIWELKQKLRLSRAMQQYLETDLDTSLSIIQHQLSNTATPLNQAQIQFLAQYQLSQAEPAKHLSGSQATPNEATTLEKGPTPQSTAIEPKSEPEPLSN